MKKYLRYLGLGFLALALVVGIGASYAGATLTLDALTITSSGALTLTGAAASTWSTSAGALTVDSAAALNLGTTNATSVSIGASGITTTNNGPFANTGTITGTSAGASALAVGRLGATTPAFLVDASTATSVTGLKVKSAAAAAGLALSVVSSGTDENLTIDAKGAGTIGIGSVSTGAVTITPATTVTGALTVNGATATFGNAVADTVVLNGRLSTSSVAGAALTLDSTYTYTEGAELRYTVTDWTGIGATNTFEGLYLRPQVNTAAAAGNLKGIEVNTVNNGVALGSMHGAYLETQVKAISANATVGPIYGIESQISLYAPTTGTLTLTEQSDVGVAAGRFQLGLNSGLADYTSVYGVLIQSNDGSVGTRTLGSGLLIRNFPAEGTQTWTKGIQITAPAVTGLSLEGAMTTGISVVNTATTGINFAGGAANQAIKVGALSSTVPGSGAVISDTNNRAMDINVDDNNVASADTAKLLSVARFRLMRYADSVAEDYAVHGLVKYSELTKSRWGAGVMGAAETTGAVTLSNLTTGVLGRFGTAATLTLTGAGDRIAAVTAFNNNSVALAGSGKSAGLLVMETDVGTPIDLDYGLEIRNSVATTGIKIGTTTTDIELQNGETIINSPNGVIAMSGGIKIPKDAASATNATIGTTPTGLACDATTLGTLTWVDDTDTAGAWVWLCEQTGGSSYAWKQLGI